jgi:hypothetical protein
MSKKFFATVFIASVVSLQLMGQDNNIEYFITISVNHYIPGNKSEKGMYPILWYDKSTIPKFMVGGFGAGVTAVKPYRERISLVGQFNISRHTYWDEPIDLRDANNQPLGELSSVTSDYAFHLLATVHYSLSEKFSAGAGLGAQVQFLSSSRMTVFNEKFVVKNNHYKTIMPVLPLELSYRWPNTIVNLRYEYGLLDRYKKDLAAYKTDRYGILTFEVGFRIKR